MTCKCGATITAYRRINDKPLCVTCFDKGFKSAKRSIDRTQKAEQEVGKEAERIDHCSSSEPCATHKMPDK